MAGERWVLSKEGSYIREKSRRHISFNGELSATHLLTMLTIVASVAATTIGWSQDRAVRLEELAQRNRQEASAVREAVGAVLAKIDRVEVLLSAVPDALVNEVFDIAAEIADPLTRIDDAERNWRRTVIDNPGEIPPPQPTSPDFEAEAALLRPIFQTVPARLGRVALSALRASQSMISVEQISGGYAPLLKYYPAQMDLFNDALSTATAARDLFINTIGSATDLFTSANLPIFDAIEYYVSLLDDIGSWSEQYYEQISEILKEIRDFLIAIIKFNDEALIQRQLPLAV